MRLQIVFLKSSFRWFWQKLKFKNYSSNSSGNCVFHMLFPLNSIIQKQNLRLGLFGLLEESSSFWNYPQKPCQKRSRLSKLQKKKLKRLQRLQSAFCDLSASLPHGGEGTLWLTGHVYKCFVIEYESDRERDWIKES